MGNAECTAGAFVRAEARLRNLEQHTDALAPRLQQRDGGPQPVANRDAVRGRAPTDAKQIRRWFTLEIGTVHRPDATKRQPHIDDRRISDDGIDHRSIDAQAVVITALAKT